MAIIYDRIDLKVTGTWYKNFRPNGLTLSFGKNLSGGDKYDTLIGATLPYGSVIGDITKKQETVINYTVDSMQLPKTTDGLQLSGVGATASGVLFPSTVIFDSKVFPQGVTDPGTNSLPNGTIVSCHIPATTKTNVTLSATTLGMGTAVVGGVQFSNNITLTGVYLPFGVKFTVPLTIGGKVYPVGTLKVSAADQFLMNTIQLVDATSKALLSVHNIATDELMAFNRATADIARLIMYKDGIGVTTDPFGCYSIVFKTNVTLADIIAFNANHPSDVNPLIIDDGSVVNPNYIIPS